MSWKSILPYRNDNEELRINSYVSYFKMNSSFFSCVCVCVCVCAVERIDDALYEPIQLTVSGGKSGVSCGLADFIAQEEMDR